MSLDPNQIGLWVNVLSAAIPLGEALVRIIKDAMKEHGLTDEEINALEREAVADAERRSLARKAMSHEGGGL